MDVQVGFLFRFMLHRQLEIFQDQLGGKKGITGQTPLGSKDDVGRSEEHHCGDDHECNDLESKFAELECGLDLCRFERSLESLVYLPQTHDLDQFNQPPGPGVWLKAAEGVNDSVMRSSASTASSARAIAALKPCGSISRAKASM